MLRFCSAMLFLGFTLRLAAGEADASAAGEAAKKAATYLLQQQNEDGTFGKSKMACVPGIVGLVVKALAGSPDRLREDHNGKQHWTTNNAPPVVLIQRAPGCSRHIGRHAKDNLLRARMHRNVAATNVLCNRSVR